MNEPRSLRVLIVEDSEFDARMLVNVLRQGGYEPDYKRVDTPEAFRQALADDTFEIILSDYSMPDFSMSDALLELRRSKRDLPFIIVSGGIGEDTAVAAMKAGAHDYLMKGQLARLAPAVERELREASVRAARRRAEEELRESELRYRMLWENSTDAVLMMDEASNIHFANPAVVKVFGYEPAEVVGKNLSLLLPIKADPTRAGFLEVLHTGTDSIERNAHETIGMRQDQTQVAIEIAFNDMHFKGQRWYVAFIRDITARKKAEQELRQHYEQFRVAHEIQQRLFPEAPPQIEGFEIAGATYPADSTGGDYFDYLNMGQDSLGIIVADVTGHGVGPAMLAAETRAYFRLLARNDEGAGDILTQANTVLADDLDYERFITVLLLKIHPKKRLVSYANAGHPAGYIFSSSGDIRHVLKRNGPPLGINPNRPYPSPDPLALESGDLILITTDGLEEATSPKDEFFGKERIFDIVRRHRHHPPQQIIRELHAAVVRFTAQSAQLDDLTMIVVRAQ